MTTYSGEIDRIIFRNNDTKWSVVIIKTKTGQKKAKGVMPELRLGMKAKISGEIVSDKYGEIVDVSEFVEELPTDIEGIEKFLASGLIRNIGPKLAHDIVTTFGTETLNVLDNEPERLKEVNGIGKKRINCIIESAKEHKEIRNIMVWLKRYDLSNGLAAKIYKEYGNLSIARLTENPYRLADDIKGVGFKKADEVAMRIGIEPESEFRIKSGLRACMEDNATEYGNTCIPYDNLICKASSEKYLNLPEEKVKEVLDDSECGITVEHEYAFLPKHFYAELRIAKDIKRIQDGENEHAGIPDIKRLEEETKMSYSHQQCEAIRKACTEKISIITGGPGTGKTVTTNAIINEFERQDMTVLCCAPTGRAAKRMNEVTGKEAKTIHRLLEFNAEGFDRNEINRLDGDALIIDEASMIDTILMESLLKAVPDEMTVVIVGDVDQLPSVGAGCVLRDLIDSEKIPTTKLTEIYRQAQGSEIIMNAHAINKGRRPNLMNPDNTDFWFFRIEDKEKVANEIVKLVTEKIPVKFGYETKDIQVLCPMKREDSCVGAIQLNRRLQAAINPDGKKVANKGETEFRVGDRIMQIKNDYDKGIFNGDLGVITGKYDGPEQGTILITAGFDGDIVTLESEDIQNIELAYACTVHKSQGSEYPVIILVMHDSQYIMLKRNLFYTGVTRAKKQCIVIGTEKAIQIACNTEDTRKRYTMLKQRINQTLNEE